MSGRRRRSEGIVYPFTEQISELSPSLHLNIDFDSLLKKGYNIIVLNHQPGIGKTYTVMDYIKKKLKENWAFSFFYFTDKHKTIKENISKHFDSLEVLHWEGFHRKITNRDAISAHQKYHLDPSAIRRVTSVNRFEIGEYYAQFSRAEYLRRVFAPFNYLSSHHFTNKYPDIIFLDENISQMVTYSLDIENASKVFESISSKHGSIWSEKLKNKEFSYFLNSKLLNNIINTYKRRAEKLLRDKDKNEELLNLLRKFNPYSFKEYINWGAIYKWKELSYTFPMYYYAAFDAVVKNVPIVILDASFNEYLFSYFLESYNGEARAAWESPGFKDLKVCILKSNHKNYDTKLYRLHPTGAWSKSSVLGRQDTTEEAISDEMRRIINVFGLDRIGIITFKEIADKAKLLGIDIEYFGNLRGSNILENKPVLIILGTWLPSPPSWRYTEDKKNKDYCIDDMVWQNFLIRLDKIDIDESFASAPQVVYDDYGKISLAKAHISMDKTFTESDSLADVAEKNPVAMMNILFFSEIYQAYHRNRGLRNNKLIFSFGWFPEPKMFINKTKEEPFFKYDLRKEFYIDKLFNEDELNNRLKPYEDVFGRWKRFIMDIEQIGNNTKIATDNHIWKGPGEGPYPGLVAEIRNKVHNKFKTELKDKEK